MVVGKWWASRLLPPQQWRPQHLQSTGYSVNGIVRYHLIGGKEMKCPYCDKFQGNSKVRGYPVKDQLRRHIEVDHVIIEPGIVRGIDGKQYHNPMRIIAT